MKHQKIFIYQLLPRLFGNKNAKNRKSGTINENGCGKFKDITTGVLKDLHKNGYTHVWYIGVIAHASTTNYTAYGIPKEYPEIIKGKAGSPYAIRDYYDVDPDLAVDVPNRIKEFKALISRTHKAGLKVIIDFVPNHVARNYKSINKPKGIIDLGENDLTDVAFSPQNNFYYLPGQSLEIQFNSTTQKRRGLRYQENPAKVTGNDCFTHQPSQFDWYETVKLNYGIKLDYGHTQKCFSPTPDTWHKMKDILLFWASFGVDGFRCDMAEMVPLEFWRWAIPQIKAAYPDIQFIGEIYNPDQYRDFLSNSCFDYLYDKVGLYDVLRDVACGYRPSSDITFTLNNVGDIQHKMLNFLENHDEQRIASDFFLKEGSKAKAAMIVTACINRNPVMIYFGQELGERGMNEEGFSGRDGKTSIFDYCSLDTIRRWNNKGKWDEEKLTPDEKALRGFYRTLLNLCNANEALRQGLFYDIMWSNYDNPDFDSTKQYAFLRGNNEELLLVIVNFDSTESEVVVNIPNDAFAFFKITKKETGRLVPLLYMESEKAVFSYNIPIRIKLKPHDGEIYKISFL